MPEFDALLQQVRAGSQDAAWKLIESYGPHVLRVVRRSISRELRADFESRDFSQAVWLSFFRNRARVCEFSTPDGLIGYLARMTRNKLLDELDKRRALKRSVDGKRPLSLSEEAVHDVLASRDPSPSQFAIAREKWNNILQGKSELHQSIVQMRFMGEQNKSIAEALKINEKTVRRVMIEFSKGLAE